MRYIVLLFICAGILCAFTVLDAPLKRCGVSRFAAAYTAFALAIAALAPSFISPHISASLPFVLTLAGLAAVMVKRRGDCMWLRLLGTTIFSAVLYFTSVLLTGTTIAPYAQALCVLGAAVYCQAIASGSDDALFLAMLCVWGGQLAAGAYEAAVNDYICFDLAADTVAACAAAAGVAAFFIKDITLYIRQCLTKRPA